MHSEMSEKQRGAIVRSLLAWYRENRRDLPWRAGATPYAIWVSEIMLQQTRVAVVVPYYGRFLERFPTVEDLAAASLDEVLKYWAGLGYYARARNLHRAARQIVAEFGGRMPDTPAALRTLPGLGRYTVGAILSQAYGVPEPAVDANVIRVLCRLAGIPGDPKSAANQKALWSLARQLVPADDPGSFNQALMELGAILCAPLEPRCSGCPLQAHCVAASRPDPSALPEYPPGRVPVACTHAAVLIRNGEGKFALYRRPLQGLWGGLWEFPRVVCAAGETPRDGACRAAREIAGLEVTLLRRVALVRHSVTHYRITLHGFLAEISGVVQKAAASEPSLRWADAGVLSDYAFSSPQVRLREALQSDSRHGVLPF